ncbi:MAG: DUF177 domain-containing protein [Paracoccaceae bacterium]|jgi:uncharacterized metal-binding protein YceD (DUF177 family)|nr:DUF177 domain-containing protein [Paracoccaceae bacterium]
MSEHAFDPTAPLPWSQPLRVADLASRKPNRFDITPDSATCAMIADWAGISMLRRLRLKGTLTPQGRSDWLLEAEFNARVVQPCAITLAPVTTDLRESVVRRYLAQMPAPSGEEAEMPEDDTTEALGSVIDLAAVALEALELALPMFPRAAGAALEQTLAAESGVTPLRDADTRPFAGLKTLLGGTQADKDGAEDTDKN